MARIIICRVEIRKPEEGEKRAKFLGGGVETARAGYLCDGLKPGRRGIKKSCTQGIHCSQLKYEQRF